MFVNSSFYLHDLILTPNEWSYAWVACELLRVLSVFTTNDENTLMEVGFV